MRRPRRLLVLPLIAIAAALGAGSGGRPASAAPGWRVDPILGVGLGVLIIGLTTGYLLRLNRSHERLRARLETQLQERRRAEEALRASELFYHSLVESLPQNILRKDAEGRFSFANRRFCNTLGRPLDAVLGKTDRDFYPAELAEKYRADDMEVMTTGVVVDTVEEYVTPDGETHYVQVIKTPLQDVDGRAIGIQGIFWDVTARRRAEELLRSQNVLLQELASSERRALEELKRTQSRLVQSAKLAGLGQMVAGVAHEINNPLSFVSNNVAVLQRDLAELCELVAMYRGADDLIGEHRPELLARICELCERVDMEYTLGNLDGLLGRTREGLRRIQQIVKDLRVFARLDESELNEVDLNPGIESTVNIVLGYAKKKRVQVDLELARLPVIACQPAKVNQVLMNLVTNAIDACREEGRVTIRTAPDATGGVRLDVIDDGCGIDPAIRERLFDPFFTTKAVGEGTGLGLSISYGIILDHGGTIEVDSVPGRGARFTVHLPPRPRPIPHDDHPAAALAPTPGATAGGP